jgi:hypothetical protein
MNRPKFIDRPSLGLRTAGEPIIGMSLARMYRSDT